MRERLQSYVWAYLSGSDVSVAGTLILPEFPPDPRFDRPQSGLYGAVFGNKINWQSGSAVGLELPWSPPLKPNEQRFFGPIASPAGPLYVLSQGVSWEVPKLGSIELTFNVAESTQGLQEQIDVYRRTLWFYLGGAGVALLLLEIAMLRLGLGPLRRVAATSRRWSAARRTGSPGATRASSSR
jgi:two-component system sensor histidine kinase PhoQ